MAITHRAVIRIGSFSVYTKHDVTPGELTRDLPGFYWNDHVTPNCHGPYDTAHQAVENYRDTLITRRTGENQNTIGFIRGSDRQTALNTQLCPVVDKYLQSTGKLIKVDFASRKRV